jgi:hypothetical protein
MVAPVVGGGSRMSLGGRVRSLDASAPVRVEVQRLVGRGGKAATSSPADRTSGGSLRSVPWRGSKSSSPREDHI